MNFSFFFSFLTLGPSVGGQWRLTPSKSPTKITQSCPKSANPARTLRWKNKKYQIFDSRIVKIEKKKKRSFFFKIEKYGNPILTKENRFCHRYSESPTKERLRGGTGGRPLLHTLHLAGPFSLSFSPNCRYCPPSPPDFLNLKTWASRRCCFSDLEVTSVRGSGSCSSLRICKRWLLMPLDNLLWIIMIDRYYGLLCVVWDDVVSLVDLTRVFKYSWSINHIRS